MMMLRNIQNLFCKKLMIALALSIGLMPVSEVFAVPKAPTKSRTAARSGTAPAKQVVDEKKEVKVEQPKTQLPKTRWTKIDALCKSHPGVEYFIDDLFLGQKVIVFYGLGAQKAAEQCKPLLGYNFWGHVIQIYDGPAAKEWAVKFHESLQQSLRKINETRKTALKIWGVILGGYVAMVVGVLAGVRISEWWERRARDAQDRARIIQIADNMYHNIPVVNWVDQNFARELLQDTARGAAFRDAVIRNGQFHRNVTDEQYQRARERIDEFRLLTLRRGMHQDVYSQALLENFPDDVDTIGARHLHDNAFNRIQQMPQAVRNFLVQSMTTCHLVALRHVLERVQALPNIAALAHAQPIDPVMPTREAVQRVMQQRMNAIMQQAQNRAN